jgi:hypothetical protein
VRVRVRVRVRACVCVCVCVRVCVCLCACEAITHSPFCKLRQCVDLWPEAGCRWHRKVNLGFKWPAESRNHRAIKLAPHSNVGATTGTVCQRWPTVRDACVDTLAALQPLL